MLTCFVVFIHKTQSENIEVEPKFKALYELDSSMFEGDFDELEDHGSIFEDDRLNMAVVAHNEVGTYGGSKYCAYYGLNRNMAWCCVFVSWCADQTGIIDEGLMPRFFSVSSGYEQFKSLGLWRSKYERPDVGMVIFFDLAGLVNDDDGERYVDGHDYRCDHVGIVKSVDDYYVYTIEGNYNNSVFEAKYPLGSADIIGYGTPLYN